MKLRLVAIIETKYWHTRHRLKGVGAVRYRGKRYAARFVAVLPNGIKKSIFASKWGTYPKWVGRFLFDEAALSRSVSGCLRRAMKEGLGRKLT